MRKSLFLAMAAVVLLAGCSKESDGITNENGGNDTETNIDPDAVKINLGMKLPSAEVSPASRGAIDDAAWDGTKVGVFALAKNATFNGADLIWNNNNLSQRILDNVEGAIKVGIPTTVELKDGPYYYPMTLGMDFTFYGYHPRVDIPVTDFESSKVITAAYDISGQEDILWGRVVAPQMKVGEDIYEGYNARYFRKNTTAAVPSITFDHKLVQLNFKLKAGIGEDGTAGESAKVTVKSINVICQNRNVNLTVANKNLMNNESPNPVEDGKITAVPVAGGSDFEPSNPAKEFLLPLYKTYGETEAEKVLYTGNPTTESAAIPIPIGMPIMLPAPALAVTSTPEENAYYIKVELVAGKNQTLSTIIAVEAPDGFKPGHSYNITIIVNGLSEIKLEATLTAWKPGTDPGEVEIN